MAERRSFAEVVKEIEAGGQGEERRVALEVASRRAEAARARIWPNSVRRLVPCRRCGAILDINGKCLSCRS